MDLAKIMKISAAGMKAQTQRMRVVAENVANANSLPTKPGEAPYRRKIVSFKNELDRETGAHTVTAGRPRLDQSPFGRRFEPGHPAADEDGYVKTPNVRTVVEMMDLRAAQRGYEANLGVVTVSRGMVQNALEMLRN